MISAIDMRTSTGTSPFGVFQNCGFENVMWRGTVDIPEYAFSGNSLLKEVNVIPRTPIRIGNYAFSGCTDLRSVYIDNRVTDIGETAFANIWGQGLTITVQGRPGRIPGAPWGANNAQIKWE